jgi:hypothetical protein
MRTFAKVVAVIVMILSAILFIAMLGGVFGTWWLRGQAVEVVTAVAASGDQALARGQELVGQANQIVQKGQGEVTKVTTGINNAGATAQDTNLVLTAAEAIFDKDLSPAVQRVQERGQDLRTTVAIVDQTVSLWRRLPGQNGSKLLDTVDELINTLTSISQSINEARASLQQAKAERIDQLVTTLTAPLEKINTSLANVSARLDQSDQRLAQGREDLVALRDRINNAITWAAVIGTFALFWMALAQLALFVHAYGVFTGRDPLGRWHKRGEASPVPVPQPAG